MPLKSIALDTLDRIVTAPNAPQVGEAALAAVKELVAADYYSAITHGLKTGATDLFHPGEGWLGPAHALVQTILRTQDEHPFVQHFFPRGQSAVYRRSDLLPDRQWQLTEAFNEVDRTLGIRDMVAIYQITAAGQLLVLTVGRSGQFRAADLESVRKLQRILSVLLVARPAPVSLVPLPPQARHSQADLLPVWGAGSRLIPAGQSGVLVQPSEILCITADGNCSTILTADQRTIKVRQTLAGWRALLPVGTFLQTDRATLINLRHIGRVEFSAHSASVHFDVPVPALDLGRNAAQKLKWAMQLNKRTPTTNIRPQHPTPTPNTQHPRTR
ncbi:MAG: LytTR family DNA-binding domain-containing protein, partial [Verrucomicrobia bacterium]|nr:LytTR family DNA-binding domain-containing protein [Verrucomicrobiota bacterium]